MPLRVDRRRDLATRQQIEAKLESEPWLDVAKLCAYGCQCAALHLEPWQPPPCWVEIDDGDDEIAPVLGRRAAAELLRRMLAAGLSRYEPDPIGALARVAAERA